MCVCGGGRWRGTGAREGGGGVKRKAGTTAAPSPSGAPRGFAPRVPPARSLGPEVWAALPRAGRRAPRCRPAGLQPGWDARCPPAHASWPAPGDHQQTCRVGWFAGGKGTPCAAASGASPAAASSLWGDRALRRPPRSPAGTGGSLCGLGIRQRSPAPVTSPTATPPVLSGPQSVRPAHSSDLPCLLRGEPVLHLTGLPTAPPALAAAERRGEERKPRESTLAPAQMAQLSHG